MSRSTAILNAQIRLGEMVRSLARASGTPQDRLIAAEPGLALSRVLMERETPRGLVETARRLLADLTAIDPASSDISPGGSAFTTTVLTMSHAEAVAIIDRLVRLHEDAQELRPDYD